MISRYSLYRKLFAIVFMLSAIVFYFSFTSIVQDVKFINQLVFVFFSFSVIASRLVFIGVSLRSLVGLFLVIFPVAVIVYLNASFSYVIAYFYIVTIFMPIYRNLKFLHILVTFKIIFLIFIVSLFSIGLLPDFTIIKLDGSIAHSLGFSHPNALGALYLSIILDFSLILGMSKYKYTSIYIAILILMTIMMYYISYSRTAIFLSLLSIMLIIFRNKLNSLFLDKIYMIMFIGVIFFLGVYLSYIYDYENEFLEKLNLLFSHRLNFANSYFEHYGVQLFPQRIEMIYSASNDMIYNENFYTGTILSQGIIFFILFLCYFLYCIMTRDISLYIFVLICLSLVCSMFEEYGMNIFFSSVFLFNLSLQKRSRFR